VWMFVVGLTVDVLSLAVTENMLCQLLHNGESLLCCESVVVLIVKQATCS